LFQKKQLRVANLATVLKKVINKIGDESMSLLRIPDINTAWQALTPRSGVSALVKETNDQ
jgi:hypothetical protein